MTGRTYGVDHVSNLVATPDLTTAYLHSGWLESGRMISSVDGYPTWQATYLPYGYEYNAQPGVDNVNYWLHPRQRKPADGLR